MGIGRDRARRRCERLRESRSLVGRKTASLGSGFRTPVESTGLQKPEMTTGELWLQRLRLYKAREATPARRPTARRTESARARIRSGESLRAGIM